MGLPGFPQGQDRAHIGPLVPFVDQPCNPIQHVIAGLGARVRAAQSAPGSVRTGRRVGADRDLNPAVPENRPGTGHRLPGEHIGGIVGLPGDRVDNDIHVPCDGFEGGGPVVDERIDAEFPEKRFVACRRRADHLRAPPLGQLDGDVPDAAGGRVDEHLLPGDQAPDLEPGIPGGQGGDRQGGGVHVVQRRGLLAEVVRGGDNIFRIPTTRQAEQAKQTGWLRSTRAHSRV